MREYKIGLYSAQVAEREGAHLTTDDGPDAAAAWWTVTDVAAYLQVKPDTVSGYKTRHQMPEPDDKIGRTPVWRPATITEWRPRPTRHEEGTDGEQPTS